MSKPVSLPNWASAQINNTEPPASKKASGYGYSDAPSSDEFNWVLWSISQWIDYVDSNAVDGALTIGTSLAVGTTLAVGTNGTITGNLAVGGSATVGGTLTATGTLSAADLKHTAVQTLIFPASTASEAVGVYDAATMSRAIGSSTTGMHFGLSPLVAGMRIKAWRLYVRHVAGVGSISAQLKKCSMNAGGPTVTTVGTPQSYGGIDVGWFYMGEAGLDEIVTSQASWAVAFTGCGTTGDLVYHLEIDVTRP